MLERTTEQWLNQWGHAEIDLSNSYNNSPLRQGQINILFPWKPHREQMLFTQWGIKRTANNTTLNIGIGQRWFHPIKGH